jgi:membrane fusion protein (multidrug efflux system)
MTMKTNRILYSLLFLALAVQLQSCSKSKRQSQFGNTPVAVSEFIVQPQRVIYYDNYPGTVQALNEVELHSQVAGFITGIFFREGSMVKKGDKLYEIDRRKYEAALQQATGNADIADANLQKAQRDADRYLKLNEQNAVAKQTLDDAMTNLQNAKTQVQSAKAALLNAETDYNYSVISAPFSGTIGFSMVKPGTFVNAGQTLLNTISTDDPMGVDFIVNEKNLTSFIALEHRKTASSDSTFRLTLPDNSDYHDFGQLSVIDRGVDARTGTVRIRLVFPNHDRELRPGMNCRVKVLDISSGEELVIPFKSVIEQMGEYFVYLIDSSKVKQVRIVPGSNLGGRITVRDGLKAGEKIVVDGLQKVHNGSLVQANEPAGKRQLADR